METKPTILCVDDESIILTLCQRVLEREGYEVRTAQNGEEGLKVLEEGGVDLIISDQRMPQMAGAEFLRRAREMHPEVVRIMMSGYSDFNGLVSALNDGEIFRFVSKPWEQQQFLEVIQLALNQRNAIRTAENVVQDVCDMARLGGKVVVDTSPDERSLTIKIGDSEDVFPKDVIGHFLETLFNSLGLKDQHALSFGTVVKDQGKLTITVDIGTGLTLRIQLPNMKTA